MNNDKTQAGNNARENADDTHRTRRDAWQRPAVTRLDAAPDTRDSIGPGTDGYEGSEHFE